MSRVLAVLAAILLLLPCPSLAQRPAAGGAALGDLSRSLQDLSQKVSASVVQIFVIGYAAPDRDDPRGAGLPAVERSSGSGVVVDPDGYIVTNAHVVENATRIEVELPLSATGGDPGRSILRRRGRALGAQIVAVDHETDIAVIKVEASALPALAFGDSDALRPGQLVLAFGSPLGLDSSVTLGIVSAVARQLTPEDPMIYIQTDAPINPGNSGGALVDTEGRLVGVNTLIYSQGGGNEGIGFAAPSNIVRNVFQQIRKSGRVRRGEIGVSTQTVTSVLGEALQLPSDAGVIVADVAPAGPAARAGLQPGDIIRALDGKPMENGRQFRINLYTRTVGDQISLDVQRGERRMTIRVPVVERDSGSARLIDLLTPQNSIRALGVLALELTPQIAQLLPAIRRDKGVIVATVSPQAPFSQQGRLEVGDVIYAFNGGPIASIADLETATAGLKPGVAAVLQIERRGGLMYLAFRFEPR
ncbi:MAG: trypsin-like peptidase domain-containing protein [Vicinamibacterales bacterium]